MFLNGAPSTGKTTLATALHQALPRPAFYQSLDTFRGAIRPDFWTRGNIPSLFSRVLDAYLPCLREVAAQGFDVIAESIILPADLPRHAELFAGHDVILIGITCPRRQRAERRRRGGNQRASCTEASGSSTAKSPWGTSAR
ncbi:hypothetical protein G3I17_08475 [Streptomyces sp. SID13031]|nr:hypothetical protein [Streptomyces sp. SID13031]